MLWKHGIARNKVTSPRSSFFSFRLLFFFFFFLLEGRETRDGKNRMHRRGSRDDRRPLRNRWLEDRSSNPRAHVHTHTRTRVYSNIHSIVSRNIHHRAQVTPRLGGVFSFFLFFSFPFFFFLDKVIANFENSVRLFLWP